MATKTKINSSRRHTVGLRREPFELLMKAVAVELSQGNSTSRERLASELLMEKMQEKYPQIFKKERV